MIKGIPRSAILRLEAASGGTWNAMKNAPGVRTSIDGTGMRLSLKVGKFEISLEAARFSTTTIWWWIVSHPTFEVRFMRGEHVGTLFRVPGVEIDRGALDAVKKAFGGDIAFENSNDIDVLRSDAFPTIPADAREFWLRYHGTLVATTTERYSRFRVPEGAVVITYTMPGCPSAEFEQIGGNALPNAFFSWYGAVISKKGNAPASGGRPRLVTTATYAGGDMMPDLELGADDPIRRMGVWSRQGNRGWKMLATPNEPLATPNEPRTTLSRFVRRHGPGVYHVTGCMNANEPVISKDLERLATHARRARARKDTSVDALYDEYLRLLETKPTKEALEKFSRKLAGFNDPK